MKKLIFLFVMVLFSCEKEPPTYCYICNRDIYNPAGYYSVVMELCGMTEDEIKVFEDDNTYDTEDTSRSMVCRKKDDL